MVRVELDQRRQVGRGVLAYVESFSLCRFIESSYRMAVLR